MSSPAASTTAPAAPTAPALPVPVPAPPTADDDPAPANQHAAGADPARKAAEHTGAEQTEAAGAPVPPRLFLYDGVCGLCDRSVQFLLRVDRDQAFHYAQLQGETAARLRAQHSEIPADLDSVVYLEHGQVSVRSRAFIRAARHLPYPWRLASWLWIIPRPLADLVYRGIARVRYRIFGRYQSCRLPAPDERARFLP